MKVNKKINIFLLITILLSGIILVYAKNLGTSGTLTLRVFDPYGNVLLEKPNNAVGNSQTIHSIKFSELAQGYKKNYEISETTSGPYCKFGGDYTYDYKWEIKANGNKRYGPDNLTGESLKYILFNCHKTADFLDYIRIPASWVNSNLLFYCNNGNMIYFKDFGLDLTTTQSDAYKVCILKNLDLKNKNTIIYGFEVGNVELDGEEDKITTPGVNGGNQEFIGNLTYVSSNIGYSITHSSQDYRLIEGECRTISSRSNNGGSCFPAGTKIYTQFNKSKNIEDIKVGDSVLSYDEKNRIYSNQKVLEIETPIRNHYYTIEFEDKSKLNVTDEHPIYSRNVLGENWASINPQNTLKYDKIKVKKLNIGDFVFKNGEWTKIVNWKRINGQIQTYNLININNTHTFFAEGVLVHNKAYNKVRGWDSQTGMDTDGDGKGDEYSGTANNNPNSCDDDGPEGSEKGDWSG